MTTGTVHTVEHLPAQNKNLLLPEELARVVPASRIEENERRLLESAPEVDEQVLAGVKEVLSSTPLIHTSNAEISRREALKPHRYMFYQSNPDNAYNIPYYTFPFDESLGLDACTFFSWPLQTDKFDHGDNLYLIDPDLLFSDRTFVTPRDIRETARTDEDEMGKPAPIDSSDEHSWREDVYEAMNDGRYSEVDLYARGRLKMDTYSKIPKADKMRIAKLFNAQLNNVYFDQLVSGAAWFEYVARRVAAGQVSEELFEAEIKHFGSVPQSRILAQENMESMDAYEKELRQKLSQALPTLP